MSQPDGDPAVLDAVGLSTYVGPYRVSASRMALAHSLMWSTSELHAKATVTPEGSVRPPMAVGSWVAAVISGLYAASTGPSQLREHGISLGALLEIEIRYLAPVFGDDIIAACCTVRRSELDLGGATGTLAVEDQCTGADGRHFLTCTRTYRFARTA